MSTDTRQVQLPVGPLIAAIGAVILIVSLFLEWYDGLTAFTVFEFVDLLLLFCALAVVAQLAVSLSGRARPPVPPGIVLAVSLFTLVVVLVQLVNDPPAVAGENGPDRALGIWLAVGGATLMAAGAILATAHISLSVEPREHRDRPGSAPSTAPRPDDPSEGPTRVDRT